MYTIDERKYHTKEMELHNKGIVWCAKHVFIHAYISVCECMYVCMYIYICMYVCVYVCECKYVCECMFVCM